MVEEGKMDTYPILIVDDDSLYRLVLKEELTQAGHGVLEAKNGAQALEHLRQAQVALVFLDYYLPDTNGIDLLHEVRKIYPACPVVILTSHPNERHSERAEESGAQYYEKPENTLEILPMIQRLLARIIHKNSPAGSNPFTLHLSA